MIPLHELYKGKKIYTVVYNRVSKDQIEHIIGNYCRTKNGEYTHYSNLEETREDASNYVMKKVTEYKNSQRDRIIKEIKEKYRIVVMWNNAKNNYFGD